MSEPEVKITVDRGSGVAWVRIHYRGKEVAYIHHQELRHLAHQVDVAIRDARLALRRGKPGLEDEV